MDWYPAEAEDTCHDSADAEDIEWTCGVGYVCWKNAADDAAARDDGEHVEGELCRQTCSVGELGDEEEWNVETDEANKGRKAEECEGQFLEAGEIDDGLAWKW